MTTKNFEKIGSFYLGQILNSATGKKSDELLLYDSKNLTTHAVCLGMTGSGKTGLCIDLLEEAGLDQIPAIIIDPKGDVSNLLLTFPNLSPQDFLPWIDEQEAKRKNLSLDDFAKEIAESWKEGLASSGIDAQRIQSLKDSVEMVIYTPGNTAGVPISILNSFAAPSKEELQDTEAFRDQVLTLASSLLALLGIDADPIKSREHILISTLIDQAWSKGENLDIAALIQRILKPPFSKIGALDIETFLSSLLGAFLGKGVTKGTITQTGNSLKRASKIGMGNQEATQAEEDVKTYQNQIDDIQEEMQKEIEAFYASNGADNVKIDKITISPRKSDIIIEKIALVWVPKA